jgi:hypothetical protein
MVSGGEDIAGCSNFLPSARCISDAFIHLPPVYLGFDEIRSRALEQCCLLLMPSPHWPAVSCLDHEDLGAEGSQVNERLSLASLFLVACK